MAPMTTATLHDRALTALRTLAGPDAEPRPHQLEAIADLVGDRGRVLCVQRTGWGKSAVYFVATSLLWVFVLFVMKAGAPPSTTPSPTPPPSSTPAHHHATTAAAAADTMATTGSEDSITAGATLRTCGNTTAEARARDCRFLFLSTHSFQAQGFYEGLGFETLATIPDKPLGHAEHWMRLDLSVRSRSPHP